MKILDIIQLMPKYTNATIEEAVFEIRIDRA